MVQDLLDRGLSRGLRAAEELSDRLLATPLATRALEPWCRERGIADGTIVVRRHPAPTPEPLDPDSLAWLGGDPRGLVFRRVDIRLCGITLVDAANWYFADRLTPAMRERLLGDTPFGEAIVELAPRRKTFSVSLAPSAEIDAAAARRLEASPVHVLEHRALLHRDDGTPIAVVHERYRAVLVS